MLMQFVRQPQADVPISDDIDDDALMARIPEV